MDKLTQTSSELHLTAPEVLERLDRARKFIDLCYDLPLDLEEISSHACFSRYHFLRLFRQAFNKTPHQYLIERRIERAKELLSANDLRVTDVCFEVGFQSLGSFSSLIPQVRWPPTHHLSREEPRDASSKAADSRMFPCDV